MIAHLGLNGTKLLYAFLKPLSNLAKYQLESLRGFSIAIYQYKKFTACGRQCFSSDGNHFQTHPRYHVTNVQAKFHEDLT